MKLSYKLWLLIYRFVPFNRDGKLIFEPYKGFIYDIEMLKMLESKHMSNDLYEIANLKRRIIENKIKWKHGERW